MKLLIQQNRVIARATDDYEGPEFYITEPEGFDPDRLGDYRFEDGQLLDKTEAQRVAEKIEALWQAADRYTSGYISGVAIGILTIGVMQQTPKAMAVTAWSGTIWAEYYARKALVTATSEDNHDFSSFGPIPHSVPELQAEVGL